MQPFNLKCEPKMSRGALENMLQMSTVQLNAACKIVDNAEAQMVKNLLPYDIHKCYELQSS